MEMPKPTAEHQKLAAFAGSWVGEETLHPSPWAPEKRQAIGRFENRMGVDGMFLVTDYEEEREGNIVFRGHGVYGWDTKRERYTMHWFDSMGSSPSETLGVWEGNKLTFTNQSNHGHGRYVHEIRDADNYRFTMENSRDGKEWALMMEGTYTRRP
jgi:hypothetical protein